MSGDTAGCQNPRSVQPLLSSGEGRVLASILQHTGQHRGEAPGLPINDTKDGAPAQGSGSHLGGGTGGLPSTWSHAGAASPGEGQEAHRTCS